MGNIIELPILRNKKNGQINTYFKQKQLPQSVIDSVKKSQSPSIKKILLEFRGVK